MASAQRDWDAMRRGREGEQTCGLGRSIAVLLGGSESGEQASEQEGTDGSQVVPPCRRHGRSQASDGQASGSSGTSLRKKERALAARSGHVHDNFVPLIERRRWETHGIMSQRSVGFMVVWTQASTCGDEERISQR